MQLRDEQFVFLKDFLVRYKPLIRLGSDADLRRFLDAVLWMCWAGAPWRALPEKFGHWNTVYKRFLDWGDLGIWQDLLVHLVDMNSDLEYVMVDSTVMRAHSCAASGKKKTRKPTKGLGGLAAVSVAKCI